MSLMVWDQTLDSLRQFAQFLWPFEFADAAGEERTRQQQRLNNFYLRMVSLQRRLEKLRTLLEKADRACQVQASVLECLPANSSEERFRASLNLEKCQSRKTRLLSRVQRGEQKYQRWQKRFQLLKECGLDNNLVR
jgi:chromosome segregation ATPase